MRRQGRRRRAFAEKSFSRRDEDEASGFSLLVLRRLIGVLVDVETRCKNASSERNPVKEGGDLRTHPVFLYFNALLLPAVSSFFLFLGFPK
jgi:hypothetical protein